MKHHHIIYTSEREALQEIVGFHNANTNSERINKPFHHKERVRVYAGTELVKKYRRNHPRAVNKTYNEANAHVDLSMMGVNIPRLYGIIHSDEECSLLMEYIESKPLTHFLVSSDPDLPQLLVSTGIELGKLFEHEFLHGDLTSYHILTNGKTYLFDLETTRRYDKNEFHNRLVKEWKKFIDSTQGRRWRIPLTKEQEEMVFEGVRETLENKKTRDILERIVMKSK